jgi:hypothetical protein
MNKNNYYQFPFWNVRFCWTSVCQKNGRKKLHLNYKKITTVDEKVCSISQGLTILGVMDEGESVVCILYQCPQMLSFCRLSIFIQNDIYIHSFITHDITKDGYR